MEGAQAQLTRRRVLVVLLALIALAAVAYTQWPREEQIARSGSNELPLGEVDVAKKTLRAYAVEYLVKSKASEEEDVATRRERIVVRRPFEAMTAEGVVAFARTAFGNEVLAVSPDIPEVDARPGVVISEAVRDGYAAERERRKVTGRVCRVYRVTDTEHLDRVRGSDEDHTDVCVDESGLILEELQRVDGEIVRLKVATSVDESPDIDDDTFDLEEPSIDVSVSGNSVQELEPDSRLPGGPFWALADPLEGFELRGRYAVIESDPQNRTDRRTAVTDVWTKGPDVVFIERLSPGRDGKALPDGPDGKRIDAGEIGRGALIYGLRTSEVRVPTERGRVVRVRGTLAPSRLVEIARSLKPLPEGPLLLKNG